MPKGSDKIIRVGMSRHCRVRCNLPASFAPTCPTRHQHDSLIIVNGTNDGPILLMTAALHGIELGGIEVIRQLTREVIDPRCAERSSPPILNPLVPCRPDEHPQDEQT
jgi:hypothetical protein